MTRLELPPRLPEGEAGSRGGPLRLAYADPPYLGCGAKLYGRHHPDASEWDSPARHAALLHTLRTDYDGWAYSCNMRDLAWVLPLVPGARVAAWVKPFASWKPRQRVHHAWEPVVFSPVRQLLPPGARGAGAVNDWHSEGRTHRRGLPGAKPDGFAIWVLELIGYRDGDELVDLFPGTGAISRAAAQMRLFA